MKMREKSKEKEIKKLSRADLVDVIIQLQKNEETLIKANEDLKERLASKEIKIERSGSLAEAAVAVSDLFERAEAAADTFVSEIERRCNEKLALAEKTLADAEAKADQIIKDAEAEAERRVETAKTKAEQIIKNAEALPLERKTEGDADEK